MVPSNQQSPEEKYPAGTLADIFMWLMQSVHTVYIDKGDTLVDSDQFTLRFKQNKKGRFYLHSVMEKG